MRVRLFDWHPQNLHFPVFHDSGNIDQCADRKTSHSELWLSRWFNFTARKQERRKSGFWPSSHQAVGEWTFRTLFFQSNGIKCNQGRGESPPCGSLPCRGTYGVATLRPGRPQLAWASRHSLVQAEKFCGGLQPNTHFFFFAMYLADFTVCRTGLRVKLYGFPLIPTHSSTIHSRQSEGRHSTKV
jgi:hypothetical protein